MADATVWPGLDLVGSDSVNDDITGSSFSDSLSSLDGADALNGLQGDDALDGCTENDSLVGGGGADIFALASNFGDTVTVGDFDAIEDLLVVELSTSADVSILGQTPTACGLVISFRSAGAVLLSDVSEPIDPNLIRFETPGTSTSA